MSDTDHRDTDHLQWVRIHMPDECSKALARFIDWNLAWRGAGWDDCLDRLMDSDAHLEITEPIHEILDSDRPRLVSAVAITLLWADKTFATEFTDEMRAVAVAATIANNEPPHTPVSQ